MAVHLFSSGLVRKVVGIDCWGQFLVERGLSEVADEGKGGNRRRGEPQAVGEVFPSVLCVCLFQSLG